MYYTITSAYNKVVRNVKNKKKNSNGKYLHAFTFNFIKLF